MTASAQYAQLLLPVFWLGMVSAISFLEAPIKFRAPGVTLPIGFGIGRMVFKALNTVEVVLVLAIWVACVFAWPGVAGLILLASATAVLAIQIVVVRPPLTKRSDRVLAGETAPRSRAHWAFVVLELVKVGLLLALIAYFIAGMIGCTS